MCFVPWLGCQCVLCKIITKSLQENVKGLVHPNVHPQVVFGNTNGDICNGTKDIRVPPLTVPATHHFDVLKSL